MEIENGILLFLLIGVPLIVGLYVKYRLKWEIGVTVQLAAGSIILLASAYIFYLTIFNDPLTPDKINRFTLFGIGLTLGALGISFLIEVRDDFKISILGRDLETGNQNNHYEMIENSQRIITPIMQLEESQNALTNQIQFLRDSISSYKPTEQQKGDKLANRKKVLTTKEYIRASFSARCHKKGSR